MEFINWDLAKRPMNWVHIFLMVLIAGIAVHLILSYQTAGGIKQ